MMPADIPFDIQMEIIKRLPVKPLIRFRSVSKPWKSFVDSFEFIKSYGARHTQPHSSSILAYKEPFSYDVPRYIFYDDNNQTLFKAVVIDDRFIYWTAFEITNDDAQNHMVVSFDMITKEFRVLDLPKSLTNELYGRSPMSASISKLRESLVVYGCIMAEGALCCGVWVMEHDSSFTKLFTIGANVGRILGFRKSGEPIFEAHKNYGEPTTTLDVYNPCSQQIKNLGIVETNGSFFIGSY
ncbi:probable galacturonosyltransferase 7 isoform X2, partial [Tanacetum coccineum]